jgi:hypothetical protein
VTEVHEPAGHELAGLVTTQTWDGRRLTFEEVLAAGQPAVYRKFGDHLLYVHGRLFDMHEPAAPVEVSLTLPSSKRGGPQVDRALTVGIEYGWRHPAGCDCSFCTHAA